MSDSIASCCDIILKICGITSQRDADLCQEIGASMLGFIFHPKSPRAVTPAQAKAIRTAGLVRVGVFVNQTPWQVLDAMDQAGLHLAQLHGDQDPDFCAQIGKSRCMRTFWPERHASREEFEAVLAPYESLCRFFLFDAGVQGGGHGAPLDWARLQGLKTSRTWLLAGGLGPHNVRQAVEACDPFGLDCNSGVELAPGVKDPDKLRALRDILRGPLHRGLTTL